MSDCETNQALISAMLDGELSEAEAAGLRTHIAECEDCRAMYQAFTALSAAMTAEEPLPEDLHDNIMSTIHAAEQATHKQKKLVRLRSLLSLAACLIVVVGTVFSLRSTLLRPKYATGDSMAPMLNSAPMMDDGEVERSADYKTSKPAANGGCAFDDTCDDSAVAEPAAAPAEPMPEATAAPEYDSSGAKALQLLELAVTEIGEAQLTGTVIASGGELFAEGQTLTVVLEAADRPLDSGLDQAAVIVVEFDRWEDDVVYARSVRPAE